MRSIVFELRWCFWFAKLHQKAGACVEHQKWRSDYPYLVHGYPSNHMGFVSYRLRIGPNLPLYI
jgi:hypothetical protein